MLSTVVLHLTHGQEAQGAIPSYDVSIHSGRGPASVSSSHSKKKTKSIAAFAKLKSKKKHLVKAGKTKESMKNWQNWNSFQINLTEVYTHNTNISGTYKLVSSTIDLAKAKNQGTIFSQGLKGQLGHMVIKHGKFYLFRPMAGHDQSDNITQVESVDFPIRTYKNGHDRFLSGKLSDKDRQYFYKLKNYVPVFKQTNEQEESNQTTLALRENYDSQVQYTCNKNHPNTYICKATVTFTKKLNDMITVNSDDKGPSAKRIPAEKI